MIELNSPTTHPLKFIKELEKLKISLNVDANRILISKLITKTTVIETKKRYMKEKYLLENAPKI